MSGRRESSSGPSGQVRLVRDLSGCAGRRLPDYVSVFNRRLTRRMAACRMQLLHPCGDGDENWAAPELTGGVKINFKLSSPVRVLNCVELEGSNSEKDRKCFKDVFVTEFRFSRKSTIIVPANSSETSCDLLERLCDRFNILPSSAERLAFYEREISLSLQDIFYRPLGKEEKPLELSLIWNLNQERKALILTDHDPTATHLAKFEVEQLRQKLASLDREEELALQAAEKRFSEYRSALEEAKRRKGKVLGLEEEEEEGRGGSGSVSR